MLLDLTARHEFHLVTVRVMLGVGLVAIWSGTFFYTKISRHVAVMTAPVRPQHRAVFGNGDRHSFPAADDV